MAAPELTELTQPAADRGSVGSGSSVSGLSGSGATRRVHPLSVPELLGDTQRAPPLAAHPLPTA